MEQRHERSGALIYGSNQPEGSPPGAGQEDTQAMEGGFHYEPGPSVGMFDSPTPKPREIPDDNDSKQQSDDSDNQSGVEPVDLETLRADIDPEIFTEFEPLAKGLPKDQVEKLVALGRKIENRNTEYWENRDREDYAILQEKFGSDLPRAAESVNALLVKYDPADELTSFLKQVGMQNNAALFKMLHRIAMDL